jgi:membrane protein required for colicin V production
MWIDIGAGVIILAYSVMGLFQGVILQLFRLGGLVLVIFYARLVAEPIGQWLALHVSIPPLVAYYIALIAGALIVYAVCVLLGRGVNRLVNAGGDAPRKVNRTLGAILGLAKGLFVAFVLLSIVDMIPAEALGRWEWARTQATDSRVLPVVHPLNPLPQLRFLADVNDYKRLLKDPEAQRMLQRLQPEVVARLQDNPKFRLAAEDPQLQQLIREEKWREVMVNEKVVALLFDKEIRRTLNELNPHAALEQADKTRPGK